MSIMDTRVDHAASVRVIAGSVARDLGWLALGEKPVSLSGLRAFFRLHSALRSHGWQGDPVNRPLRPICERIFASEPDDRRAFVRGLRSVAGIVVEDDPDQPATISDRDVFWNCVEALGRETGRSMPARPYEHVGPVVRGH